MPKDTLLEFLWSDPKTSRRGPKPQVNRGRIVEAAIKIADSEGIDAASMQRIAVEVEVTKMALYRHIPGRSELIGLMIEVGLGPAPAVAGPWHEGLRNWADAMETALSRHRWLSSALVGPRPIGPGELGWTEAGLDALSDAPLSASERLDTLVLVGSHVRGIVEQNGVHTTATERASGARLTALLREHREEFPLSMEAYSGTATADTADQAYDYGLQRILAGVAALIESR
ncbi:TetR/AcrR family transcriptional regulator [Brevibacterium pigmentatum]|uniref:TetR/AcrR family transcriptional regulator n=1 Tax=Brevibacterium pigmentatum TaxID=1496080 RepID=UPI00141FCC17|nr:TetR/AcrR family transcriptional regulator [Brevibacterium pigmentatum]